MKAIINIKYTDKPAASIRYFSDKKKVVRTLDGLNTGIAVGKAKDLEALLLADHHDVTACRIARTFVLSVDTPKDATPEQLKEIDDGLIQAFGDFKKAVDNINMLGWIHGNTRTRHIHGIFPNSNGRRGLDMGPKYLSKLQDFFGLGPSLRDAVKVNAKRFPSIHAPKHYPFATSPKHWSLSIRVRIWRVL